MSYASYERLPSICSYADAERILNNAAPIRRSNPVRYPLGDRRYSEQFGIRKVGDEASKPADSRYQQAPGSQPEDIELLLYRCPVVVFHAGTSEFTVYSGPYYRWSMADCAFIYETLCGYFPKVNTDRGRLVLTAREQTPDGKRVRYTLPQKGHLRFIYDKETATVQIKEGEDTGAGTLLNTTLRLNRKATNNVRTRYGAFYRYVKGMIGVRKELREYRYYDYQGQETVTDSVYKVVVNGEELVEHIHPRSETYRWLGAWPTNKPPKVATKTIYNEFNKAWDNKDTTEPYELWLAGVQNFIDLITVKQGEEPDTERFYKAFVYLAFFANQHERLAVSAGHSIAVETENFGKTLDGIIFRYHSEEVFERVPVKASQVPNLKYETWVTRERD